MLRNFIFTTIRNATREWPFALINIFGLSLGIAAFLFIIQYTKLESNIDTFHEKVDRIYKVYSDLKWNSMETKFPQSSPAMGTSVIKDIPEVELVTRSRMLDEIHVKLEDDLFIEDEVLVVDSNFLKVFDFKLIEGNRDELFKDPSDLVLSESMARKYFGSESPIGKMLEVNLMLKRVTGVIEDPRPDSHIYYSMLYSINSDDFVEHMEWSWIWSNLNIYLLLKEGVTEEMVEAKFPALVENNAEYTVQRLTGSSLEDFINNGNRLAYFLEPLSGLYYDEDNNMGPSGNKVYITTFSIVGFIILLLACINYANLATSRSLNRAREVGVRKAIGSTRGNLITQFLVESFVFSIAATVLAIAIGAILNNLLAEPFGIRWDLSPLQSTSNLITIALLTLGVALSCGLYPALYLSAFNPASALKGRSKHASGAGLLRNSLLVLQFVISFGIIIMSFAVNSQLDYLKTKDHGFKLDPLLVIRNADLLESRDAFKNSLKELNEVQAASFSNIVPGINGNYELFKKLDNSDEDFIFFLVDTDEDYLETFGIELEEGVFFEKKHINNPLKNVVINELAVKALAYDDPIGGRIVALDNGGELNISGIIKPTDFTFGMEQPIPTVIRPYDEKSAIHRLSLITVKLNTVDLQGTLKDIEEIWKKQETGKEFSFTFFDQLFDKQFRSENRLKDLMNAFTVIGIFIAMLGMVGLISYNTEQAKKMIAIRKVFGASIPKIVMILTVEFIKLLVIAAVISIPLSNYFITDWLTGFEYKIDLTLKIFTIPITVIFALAIFTSWLQTYKAAASNPVDSIGE